MKSTALNSIKLYDLIKNAPVLYANKAPAGQPEPINGYSSPGCAKSTLIEHALPKVLSAATGKPVRVITERIPDRDPIDLRGIAVPVKREGKQPITQYTLPDIVAKVDAILDDDPETIIILYLDELMQGDHLTQKAAAPLLLDNLIGDHRLPPNVWCWATSNFSDDKAGVSRQLTHLSNRVPHYRLTMPASDWCSWARSQGLHAAGVIYVDRKPGVFETPTVKQDEPFPTFRSMTKALGFIQAWNDQHGVTDPRHLPDDNFVRRTVEGYIGQETATDFFALAPVLQELPAPEEIFDAPETAKVPADVPTQFAASAVVTELALQAGRTYDQVNACVDYLLRLNVELTVKSLFAIQNNERGGNVMNNPKAAAFVMKHRTLLARMTSF